jgi:hypothetical protein
VRDNHSKIKAKACREGADMEDKTTETKEQILEIIQFHLPTLTERQLRMVRGFIRGLKKEK